VAEVEALLPAQWWPGQVPKALRATAGGPGWRLWKALLDRCLINGTGGRDNLAFLARAISGQADVSMDTLRTWAAGLPDRSGPPPAGE
jgi:hypothetical protein